jgi:hypothetical protein
MEVRKGPWIMIAASCVVLIALAFGLALRVPRTVTAATTTTTTAASSPRPVAVHWGANDFVEATTPGQLCVTDPTRGRFCGSYTIGQKPADALKQTLAARGLSTVSR